jgi:hypothetical protein
MWEHSANIALHAGVISAITFVGTGTNDLVVTGNPGFAATRQYKVIIDSTGETFKWSNDNGGTFEETAVPMHKANPVAYPLRNAEGELEGISIRFKSNTGHVNADSFAFTTTGTVVSDSEVNVGGVIVNSNNADGMILHGQYAKGTEDGLKLFVNPMLRGSASSYYNEISLPLSLGDGGLSHKREYFAMTASANYSYRVNLLGVGAFRVRQISSGGAETGLFTCFADFYKVR